MRILFRFSLRHLFHAHLIEIILSLQTIYYCLASSIGQYIYRYYLESYSETIDFNSDFWLLSNTFNTTIINKIHQCNDRSVPAPAHQWAQQKSSNLFFYQTVASSIPTIVMTYILGLYTHQLGRKFVLILTMFADHWWHIAAFLSSLAGGGNVSSFILNLIITDSTKESERTSKFLHTGAVCTAVGAITSFLVGFWIEYRGFLDLYLAALFIQLMTILAVHVYMRPQSLTPVLSINSNYHNHNNKRTTKYDQLIRICMVFSPRHTNRSRKRSMCLIITLVAFMFHCLASLSFGVPFLWFQLNYPFCWSATDIGYYNTISSIIWTVGSIVGMKFFTYAHFGDATICCLSHIFFIVSALWVAQASYSWQLYLGLFIAPFTSYQGSLTYSIISKWLEPNEINNAYTFVTEINTILNVFGNSFFNYLYSITVSYSRNFTLILAAVLGVIPLVLNCILYRVTIRISDESDHRITECIPILIPNHMPMIEPAGMEAVRFPAKISKRIQ
ncbi:unnamed protein product [Rotaria magnacalcarata]|uniref:Uncharacterized protein n=4 Tax=Rotaria magnacalcarata TaxID=392030 RepID=A0A816BL99_9BILA|nr:unnamed protein product [Rotaria magnacalcarata]CAF1928272.1 unnamed protein product [Rotaria magnacalcarata]CAF4022914.1 unnamed protein product [Rotaria magnacalcarata]